MNKILLLLVACILSVSTCHKKVSTVVDGTMIAVEDTLTKPQLDSVFIADELSFDIENNWIPFCVLTEDKKDFLYKYVYVKSLTDSTELIYTLRTYQDTLYILNKRITK